MWVNLDPFTILHSEFLQPFPSSTCRVSRSKTGRTCFHRSRRRLRGKRPWLFCRHRCSKPHQRSLPPSSVSRETSSLVMGTLSGLGRPTGKELIAKQVPQSASQVQLVWLIGIITRIYNPLFAPISRKKEMKPTIISQFFLMSRNITFDTISYP